MEPTYLTPRAAARDLTGKATMQPYQTARAECGEVLIVEDMREVSNVISWALLHMGYTPHEAHGGREAISIFDANPDNFILAIIDIQLQVLSGLDVMLRLREHRPRLPVILISGSPLPGHGENLDAEFLRKPFRIEELEAAVWKTLV